MIFKLLKKMKRYAYQLVDFDSISGLSNEIKSKLKQ